MANANPVVPASTRIVSLKNRAVGVTVRHTDETVQYTYPSTKLALGKPELRIKNRPEGLDAIDLSQIRTSIFGNLVQGELSVKEANLYMYLKAREIEGELITEWTSYNLTIGAAGARITPLDLIRIVTVNDDMADLRAGTDPGSEQDLFLLSYLFCIYRYSRANSQLQRTNLTTQINAFLTSLPGQTRRGDIRVYPGASPIGQNFETDNTFVGLISMYDMFFSKFDKHELAMSRFGSQSARHKDCASLLIFRHTQHHLGLATPGDLMKWVFTQELETEIFRLYQDSEEYDLNDSYFPYQVEFRLVTKSPYSSVACPAIYFFCGAILAIEAETRGLNARHLLTSNVANTLANAKIVAFAIGKSTDLSLRVATEAEYDSLTTTANTEQDDIPDLMARPTTRSSADWFSYYTINPEAAAEIENHARQRIQRSTGLRPGSIGHYIAQTVLEQ